MKFQVVYKKSEWELRQNSSDEHIRKLIKENGPAVGRWKKSHETQSRSLDLVIKALDELGANYDSYYRAHLDGEIDADVVIAVGGDGTVLETSHYVKDAKILGVNSDPEMSVGYFSLTHAGGFKNNLENIEDIPVTHLQRMQVAKDGWTIPELVLNDVFLADKEPAATSRYKMGEKRFKDSGHLICTAAGSTAWMYQVGGNPMHISNTKFQHRALGLRNAKSEYADNLAITSLMREGMMHIDGPHIKYKFPMGTVVEISAGKPLQLFGDLEAKRMDFLNNQ